MVERCPGGTACAAPPEESSRRRSAQERRARELGELERLCGNQAPAGGSTMPPHSGSAVAPGTLRLQEPSDSPGTFTQMYASTSCLPSASGDAWLTVGRAPTP